MKKLIIIIILFFVTSIYSGPNANEASFGTNYAVTMVSYGFLHKVLGMEPIPAFIFSALGSMAIGMSSDLMNPKNTNNQLNTSYIYRNIGTGSAGLTILMFRF